MEYLSFEQVWQGFLDSSPASLTCLSEWRADSCVLRRLCTRECTVRGVWRGEEPYALEFTGPSWQVAILRTTFCTALRCPGAPRLHIIQEGNRVLEVEFKEA
ncbi:MAG: hypothetical protein ACOY93_07850 [Bacillota bacterium]